MTPAINPPRHSRPIVPDAGIALQELDTCPNPAGGAIKGTGSITAAGTGGTTGTAGTAETPFTAAPAVVP